MTTTASATGAATASERVAAAAARLFAERGYANVTIRQIAAEAGLSPAMVMKVGGSKEEIYAAATPPEPEPLSADWPTDQIGRELVRRIIERRDTGAVEPWIQALLSTLDSPDPARARAEFTDHYVARLQRRIGDDGRARAELVAAMLIGLAAAVRPLGLLETERDWIIERYGSMIQSLVDVRDR